jgi:haloalkane dehalogenase
MPYRTPDDRFDDLPDFPYPPNYVTVRPEAAGVDLRMHYVDTGDASEESTILCLHGEPTWSFLYRHVIPPLQTSHRVVAPDFPGFGRSDKLTEPDAYSFDLHYQALEQFVEALGLTDVTLVVQDWGGLLGLTYAARTPERIARLVVLNTFLPTGEEEKSTGFLAWRRFVQNTPDFPVSEVVRRGLSDATALSDAEAAAYDAPFPTAASKAGAVAWPLLVPMSPDDPVADVMRDTRQRLSTWDRPAFVLFAPDDPILGGAADFFRSLLPTASDQPATTIDGASHFLQEERGPEIAEHILDFLHRTG